MIRYGWWLVDNDGDPSYQPFAHFRAKFLTIMLFDHALFLYRGKVERVQGDHQREECMYLDGYDQS